MRYLVGTSGWQYRDWRGVLYPEAVPQRRWLEEYAGHFATLEVNNAFYRLPERGVFEDWRARTPSGFVMAVKASRYLTHIKRLKEPTEPVGRLMERASALGDRLGPILLQLPPTLEAVPDRLDECLGAFPGGVRVAVEPRHRSWWSDQVREILTRHGAALCWADRDGRPVTPEWCTTSWGYLRLHHGLAKPFPRYGKQALRSWIRRAEERLPRDGDCYVYFNNDHGGAAVHDADMFQQVLHAWSQPAR